METRYYGFSLIELMITITIISILTAIAIPSYQQYSRRARFAEIITATEPFKIAVSLALQEGASLNELDNNAHGIPSEPIPTKNMASLKVKQGVITATGTNITSNATFILRPDSEGTHWTVSGSCIESGLCET